MPFADKQGYVDAFLRHFDGFTPENELKMDALRPTADRWNFKAADEMLAFARTHRRRVRGHTLVWHSQVPRWVEERTWDRASLMAFLKDHIQTTVGRYRGQIAEWDVVNEAFDDDGSLRRTLWLDVIGPEYLELALRWAHEADPAAKLYINDFGNERDNAKSDGMLRVARELRDRGVPLSGIGFQSHLKTTWHPTSAELRANLARFTALGLDVHLTELDVGTSETSGSTAQRLGLQAAVYEQVTAACVATPRCTGVTVWGVSDLSTWLGSAEMPLLLDPAFAPKPALAAVERALRVPKGA